MLLKLSLANRTYNNIHRQFSFIRSAFFGNEYNCFVAKVYFCFLLQTVPKSYTRLEKSKYIFPQVPNNCTVYFHGSCTKEKNNNFIYNPL